MRHPAALLVALLAALLAAMLVSLQATVALSVSISGARPFLPTVLPPESTAKLAASPSNYIIGAPIKKGPAMLPTALPDLPREAPPPRLAPPEATTPMAPTPETGQAPTPSLEAADPATTPSSPASTATREPVSTDTPHRPSTPSTPAPTEWEPRMPLPPHGPPRESHPKAGSQAGSLDDLLEAWEPFSVGRRWSSWLRTLSDPSWGRVGASPDDPSWRQCSAHLALYLESLSQGKAWSLMRKSNKSYKIRDAKTELVQ